MPVSFELHADGEILALEVVGGVRESNLRRGLKELESIEKWPIKLLLDWTHFDKRGLETDILVREMELLERFNRIAIVLNPKQEERAELLIERRAKNAVVRRFPASKREAALEWLEASG